MKEAVDVCRSKDHSSPGEPGDAVGEPIAVVGIGCRLPGADGPEELWKLLRDGVDATSEVPEDRFDVDAFYDPRRGIPGTMYTRRGGYLHHSKDFDAAFFGISPREAGKVDPQQRMLLEVTWEALEDAGLVAEELRESQTGIFVGMWINDYNDLLGLAPRSLDLYCVTGGSRFSASGRLSYFLGLEGPSITVDTACSSSLTAVHLACQSLRAGECPIALAGGSNLILHPQATISMCRANVIAGDGRCKFGSARGDGFGRGEGVAMVVLKTLERARRDGDPIYALIRGSAVNNNGRSSGLLVTPGDRTQTAVFEQACAAAGVSPADLQYVEAHGTGTPVGDPIEIKALAAALSAAGRGSEDPCLIGSVKSNLAHSEGAAGIAGLIKVALSLKHRQIPPSLHCEELNPAVPWDELPVEMCRELRPWPGDGKRALAGLNSFGLAGSNAHAILEAVPAENPAPVVELPAERPGLLLLSARGTAALEARAEQMGRRLAVLTKSETDGVADGGMAELGEICATAARRRSQLEHRLAVVGRDARQIEEKLNAHARGESRPGLAVGRRSEEASKLVFVFPGQGSQWLGMGRSLLEREPVFRSAMERCDAAIERQVGWSVLAELAAGEEDSRLGEMGVVQPTLFAVEVALAELWRSWGLEPDAVVGHSMGEVAAAHVAGILDLDDAARVICLRSRLLQKMSGRGAMALVELSLEAARQEIAGREERVSIAVSNSPTSTVLAGDPEAIQEIIERLEERDVFCRRVNVPIAAHSPQIDPLRPELLRLLDGLRPRRATTPFFSTVSGAFLDGGGLEGGGLDAEYWARNLRQPVYFAAALESLIGKGHRHFIEISPHPILLTAIKEALERGVEAEIGMAVASLRREEDEQENLLAALGELWAVGRTFDARTLFGDRPARAKLPRYPWQRESFAIDGVEAQRWGTAGSGQSGAHPLLGPPRRNALEPRRVYFDLRLAEAGAGFLNDHRVQEEVLLPAAAMVEMALGAGRQVLGSEPLELADGRFDRALVLDREKKERQVAQLVLELEPASRALTFGLYSSSRDAAEDPAGEWRAHVTGRIRAATADAAEPSDRPVGEESLSGEELPGTELYERLARRGYDYGPAFQGLERIWARDGETDARLRPASDLGLAVGGFAVHPALLDAAFQASLAAEEDGPTWVPVGLESLRIVRQPEPGTALWSLARRRPAEDSGVDEPLADVEVRDADGRLVLSARGLRFRALDAAPSSAGEPDDWLYRVAWRATPAPSATAGPAGDWLLLSDSGGLGERLAAALEERGARVLALAASPPDELGERLVEALAEGPEWRGVVHLASADAPSLMASDRPQLESSWDLGSCGALAALHALANHVNGRPPRFILVTRGAQAVLEGEAPEAAQAGVIGLGRVIANEHPELRSARLDLSREPGAGEIAGLADELLADEWLAASGGDEIALRGGERYEPRIESYAPPSASAGAARRPAAPGEDFRLELDRPGVLDDLELRPVSRRAPGPGEVEIEVAAAGLNFRDVLVALGSIPDPSGRPRLGLECAGRITAVGEGIEHLAPGDEVVAVAPRAFASRVTTAAALVAPKPARLDMEEAATVPIAFATAYHSLVDVARLRRGEKVLIHSAAGGVGLAAVRIAQSVGAEIFATAGQPEKRIYLQSLGIRNVMDSRSLDFAEQVMEATGGQGVDVVLNSLAGEGIAKGVACLAPYGRFLELGKVDFLADSALGLAPFIRNLSFHGIDLERMYRDDHDRFAPLLDATLDFFESHALEPLPRKTFAIGEVAAAFRHMAQGRHIGKIVTRVEGETVELVAGRGALRADATYLLTGGLGGVGLALAEWMVEQGARHLVLLGRSAPGEEARAALERMAAAGAEVRAARADVTDRTSLAAVVDEIAAAGPPLKGVIHGAMVLDDGTLRQLDRERFVRVMAPKVIGAWNLDLLCRDCELDFFVLFSSAAALVGSPGQGNYAAANAFLDALAHHRRARGLPGLSIAWGPWAEVGAAARPDRGGRLSSRGMASFTPRQGLEIFGRLAAAEGREGSAALAGVVPMDWRRWAEAHPAAASASLFAEVLGDGGEPAAAHGGLIDELRALPADERRPKLEEFVAATLSKVMGLTAARIDVDQPIHRMGLDSLMAVELRNRIERESGVAISIPKLLQGRSVRQLAAQIETALEEELTLEEELALEEEVAAERVADMSDDQVDDLLLRMLAEEEA